MKIYEIGTGYTSIPARMGAATEIVVEELTKAFSENGHDVTLVDIKDPNRLPNDLSIIEVNVPAIFTKTDVALGLMHKLKRVVYSVSLASKLKKIIRKSDEKLVLHFHNQYNLYFFLKLISKKLRRKVKIAYTVHSYIWPKEWSEIESTVKKKYFQEVECVRNADCVFILNDKTQEHFVNRLGVDSHKIYKIKNGVNTEIYKPLSASENMAFKESAGLGGKKFVLQVGSICDRKNQFEAVQMLTDYLKLHSDVAFVYAGGIIDAEYFEIISKYASDHGISDQVIYAGELQPGQTLNMYYSAANVMIFPSKLESFGMVVIEALSSGTKVLTAEPLLFGLDAGCAVYGNKDQLLKMIDQMLSNKQIELDGRREVIDKYSWQTVSADHFDIMLKI